MSGPVVRSEPRPGVVQLTLSRPDTLNAMNQPLVDELHRHLRELAGDATCRVVVLTGAGRGFCAGLDLDGFGTVPGTEDYGRTHQTWSVQRAIPGLVQQLRRLPQPVIAAVNGPAAGGGLALVCASDIRIASSTAVFATSFIRIGVTGCDIGTSWLLPRLIGLTRAADVLLSSRVVLAEEALAMGLVNQVAPPDELMEVVGTYARTLATEVSPASLAATKLQLYLDLHRDAGASGRDAEARLRAMMRAPDFAEGVAALVEKRPPAFPDPLG